MKPSIIDTRSNVRSAVRIALTASALSSLVIPHAQAAEEETELQQIVVTGSRIAQPNLEGISPITTVTAEDFKVEGAARVEDLLNRLPQVFAGQAATLSNAADGTATVDLRGLGAQRTLVLINGRRMVLGDPSVDSLAADINSVPSSLIKRVEIMTGGASATYGADAVAGVVNFIMDDKFEGLRLDTQYSFYQHRNRNDVTPELLAARRAQGFSGFEAPKKNVTDGGAWDITATMGTSFADGAGHLTAYAGYRTINAITQDKRDYSTCTIQTTATAIQCGGSATSFPGTVFLYDPDLDGFEGSTTYSLAPGRGIEPGLTRRYNFAPTNYFQRPDTRYTGGIFANYEVSDAVKPYMEFMFMDDRSIAQIAPSGNFGNTLQINCDNPLLSPAQAAIVCDDDNLVNGYLGNYPLTTTSNPGPAALDFIDPTTGDTYNKAFFQPLRRNVEGGPRIDDRQHTSFKQTVGLGGDLGSGWSYDTYYQFGRTNFNETYSNEFSTARLTRALDVVADPRAGTTFGNPVCRSVVDGSDPLCVPYDILSGGEISPAAVKYLSAQGFQRGNIDQRIFSAAVTGDLGQFGMQLPWTGNGVGVAFGVEAHRDSVDFKTDNAFTTGDLTGQGAPTLPVNGSIRAKEVFAEVQVPVITDGVVKNLTFNAGYRYSDYKTSGENAFDTNTWKIGFEFAPVQDLRFRAGLNRAVRAPNVVELFAPKFVALDGSNDPCADLIDDNGTPDDESDDSPRGVAATDYGCLAQGLDIGDFVAGNPAGQYQAQLGGTPTLKPERATTRSVGVIIEPASLLPNFSLTIDYYDIKVKDAIQGFGSDAIVNACVTDSTATSTSPACSLVFRNPVSGTLWLTPDGYIQNLKENVGGVRTTGVDFNGMYSYNLPFGKLGADMVGTLITKYEVDNGLSEPYDCAGYFGSTCSALSSTPSAPSAKWRHNLRLSLEMPNGIGTSLQWRYFGPVKVDFSSSDASLAGDFDPYDAKVNAQNYLDLAGWYRLAEKYTFRVGINNVLDREPPLVSSGRSNGARNPCPTGPCNGNTYPAVYDALGRYVFASFSASF
jgi:outer membrane receptor protein involved in Fe transport